MKIVNAAIEKDGIVYVGRRHNEILCDASRPFGFLKKGKQGFVTDTGEFVDRIQAAKIAYENKQLPDKKIRLCSEDLW